MRITALVENQRKNELKAIHGLSLYIETQRHKILFDLGPDDTLFDNAKMRGIDLGEVDTVIISHGHMDHGGALRRFLEINKIADIYVQKEAFKPHYSKFLFKKISIGIDDMLINHPRVTLIEGDYQIDEELLLFTVKDRDKCYSKANDTLYVNGEKDDFSHEHNLIIRERQTALIMGCGHAGVVNIMEKAATYCPQLCVGGYHLFNPLTRRTVPVTLLADISRELQKYPEIQFYTCHCTGTEAFRYLSQQMPNLSYLSCGETIET